MPGFKATTQQRTKPAVENPKATCTTGTWSPQMWEVTGRKLTRENLIAQRLCYQCPVRKNCAKDAMVLPSSGVIRAGVAYALNGRAFK